VGLYLGPFWRKKRCVSNTLWIAARRVSRLCPGESLARAVPLRPMARQIAPRGRLCGGDGVAGMRRAAGRSYWLGLIFGETLPTYALPVAYPRRGDGARGRRRDGVAVAT
jgi:hypothetical protein